MKPMRSRGRSLEAGTQEHVPELMRSGGSAFLMAAPFVTTSRHSPFHRCPTNGPSMTSSCPTSILPQLVPGLSPQAHIFLEASPSSPIPRLSLQECTHCIQISLMPQEIRLLLAITLNLDSVGQRVHRLPVSSNETASKIYS